VNEEFKTRTRLLYEVGAWHRSMRELEERCEQAEEALRAIEQRDQHLGDSAQLGIFTTDVHGRITGLNRKMREMVLSFTREDVTPADLFEFQPLVEAGVVEDFRHCIEKKESIVTNNLCVTPQGESLHLRFNLSPVPDGVGAVSGVLAFVEDITNLKLAEVAIRESEERYRLLFNSTPIALIESDASQLKTYLDRLRASGVTDFSE
jgi:PAS domain S-box-containing protein